MNTNDRVRLQHMLEAAQMAVNLIQGETRASLDHDYKLHLALTKAVEIIGEAAAKITAETRTNYPYVSWSGIIGMRNILIHAYFNIDFDKLWDTARLDLPPLIRQLEKILTSQTD